MLFFTLPWNTICPLALITQEALQPSARLISHSHPRGRWGKNNKSSSSGVSSSAPPASSSSSCGECERIIIPYWFYISFPPPPSVFGYRVNYSVRLPLASILRIPKLHFLISLLLRPPSWHDMEYMLLLPSTALESSSSSSPHVHLLGGPKIPMKGNEFLVLLNFPQPK